MTVETDEAEEIEPTARLLIRGAQIEPWTSAMIDRESPGYLIELKLSRPATPAEKIVFKEQRGEAGKEGYQLGELSVQKLKLAKGKVVVGPLTADQMRSVADQLDQLIRDVERLAKERTAKAKADWELASDDLASISWSDGDAPS